MYAQPPYSGTIFIDPNIITSSDPSSFVSSTYTGQGQVTMYDRRVADWVTVNAYLFDVVWDDGLTTIAQVNPEFESVASAAFEAEKYAYLIGQLPNCLRTDINELWIHKGVELFGGGNNSILIHTGQSTLYENDGIIEETLVHEASHTSLDATHANHPDWIQAQNLDANFISTYAQDNPTTEDIAESYLTWLAVRYRAEAISTTDYNNIIQAIPNRLAYFDAIVCDLYPFDQALSVLENQEHTFKIFPNPSFEVIYIRGSVDIQAGDIKIFNILGQDLTNLITYSDQTIQVSKLPKGYYFLKIKDVTKRILKL